MKTRRRQIYPAGTYSTCIPPLPARSWPACWTGCGEKADANPSRFVHSDLAPALSHMSRGCSRPHCLIQEGLRSFRAICELPSIYLRATILPVLTSSISAVPPGRWAGIGLRHGGRIGGKRFRFIEECSFAALTHLADHAERLTLFSWTDVICSISR